MINKLDIMLYDFYKEMENQEAHFKKIYDAAAAEGCKLKFGEVTSIPPNAKLTKALILVFEKYVFKKQTENIAVVNNFSCDNTV